MYVLYFCYECARDAEVVSVQDFDIFKAMGQRSKESNKAQMSFKLSPSMWSPVRRYPQCP